ncbi:hypothetical protein SAMN04488556_3471 [Halostagnicola kamekurae]|uniref:Uncharacterized protein n=1 Tax=Halostagnicola kamekurae TaxID=619731 RepID=A0A1I6TVZ9_9EURY|nr:hypothetical protein SAMN04488556_3471 [Halostagnicola kamekurae]
MYSVIVTERIAWFVDTATWPHSSDYDAMNDRQFRRTEALCGPAHEWLFGDRTLAVVWCVVALS